MLAGPANASQPNSQPNVLLIMADEQRWDTLGANGNQEARTPHLDRLAARGASFRHCYTPYPLCCPARASLWTGRMPHAHHVLGNWRHIRPELAAGGLVHAFAGAGYHTLYTGKWHVPGTTPARFGFADTAAIPAVLRGRDRGRYIEPYREYARARGFGLLADSMENLTAGDAARLHRPGEAPCGRAAIPYPHFLETWQTSRFLQRLEQRPEGRPFFAVCSFNAPHFPMIVPAPYDRLIDPARVPLPAGLREGPAAKPAEVARSAYARHAADLDGGQWRRLIAHYWGLCSLVDAQVGRIVAYLEREGLLESTLVVFTADHGDMMGTHGLLEKGYPLHYEPALRVPLLIAGPGTSGGARPEGIVTLLDVLPTIAALTGVHLPEGHGGSSAAGAVQGDPSAPLRPYAVAESFTFDGTEGGAGEYTSLDDFEAHRGTANLSLRTPEARYILRWDGTEELYDHTRDPDELQDLAAEPGRAGQRTSLREMLLRDVAGCAPRLAQLVRGRIESGAGARP
jgi:arylsulfatase A-like enzyme